MSAVEDVLGSPASWISSVAAVAVRGIHAAIAKRKSLPKGKIPLDCSILGLFINLFYISGILP